MRKRLPAILILSAVLFSCVVPVADRNEKLLDDASRMSTDTFHLLCQYWQLVDADHPASRDVSFKEDSILFQPGIVFLSDSSVLENPAGKMSYGKFAISGQRINVRFDHGSKAVYTVRHLNQDQLRLRRTDNNHTSELFYKSTRTSWPDAAKNPFSQANYQWTRKPERPESDAEIRKRVKASIRFYKYYFDGFLNGHAENIDFTGLPSCLNWYQGGITVQDEATLDKKWIRCFYSRKQAYKGRQMMEDAIIKKYSWDAREKNWLRQTSGVLQQIYDRF